MGVRRACALAVAALTLTGEVRADDEAARCLALATYWESKGCGREDMTGVGWVVLNRLADDEFPDDVCAVVKDGGESPPCQFSWWCDGKSDQPEGGEDWRLARSIAEDLLDQPPPDPTRGALYFHSRDLEPPWPDLQQTADLGCHLFYK